MVHTFTGTYDIYTTLIYYLPIEKQIHLLEASTRKLNESPFNFKHLRKIRLSNEKLKANSVSVFEFKQLFLHQISKFGVIFKWDYLYTTTR